MKVFVSHNKADKATARALAVLLVEQGVDVWFDEWELRPGDSIVGGIETGLSDANVFVLLWSSNALSSNWVGTELRAYIRRRVDDDSLKIIPLMIDGTGLPSLVADYRGFDLTDGTQLKDIVVEMTGKPRDIDVAKMLQRRLLDINTAQAEDGDPLPYLVCPNCASDKFKRSMATDHRRDEVYYTISCEDCGWGDWTQ